MAMAPSLKTQNPEAASRIAWCRPPEMLTACWARPLCTCSAASTLPPVISAAASYIPSKIGLSAVPRPCPTSGSDGARRDRLEVGGVVHQGEQVDAGRRRP